MGEEVRMTDYCCGNGGGDKDDNGVVDGDADDDEEDDRVIEWESGLPDCEDLTPLCQALIPPELASAFSISPEPSRTVGDVARASQNTLSCLRGGGGGGASSQAFSTTNNNKKFKSLDGENDDRREEDDEEDDMIVDRSDGGSKKQPRERESVEEADSATDGSKATKRPRLVWTPQLHKRFVDVVAHLGIKNAVPKTIMQLMNVEGLTRENVASHLQKYRLYLKRMQGGGGSMIGNGDGGGGGGGMGAAGSSASDQLFASTPVPPRSLNNDSGGGGVGGSGGHGHNGTYGSYGHGDEGNVHMPMPMMMGYGMPGGMMGMPVYGMYGGHVGMQMDGGHHHLYGSTVPYPQRPGSSNDK